MSHTKDNESSLYGGDNQLSGQHKTINHLYTELRKAKHNSRGEREHAIEVLQITNEFLSGFESIANEGLSVPLIKLQAALIALDGGMVEDIVRPCKPTKGGAVPISDYRNMIKGLAVLFSTRLVETGLTQPEADTEVAKLLKRAKIKSSRGRYPEVSARTIRGWREQVREDVGGKTFLGQYVNSLIADESLRCNGRSREQARSFYSRALSEMLKRME